MKTMNYSINNLTDFGWIRYKMFKAGVRSLETQRLDGFLDFIVLQAWFDSFDCPKSVQTLVAYPAVVEVISPDKPFVSDVIRVSYGVFYRENRFVLDICFNDDFHKYGSDFKATLQKYLFDLFLEEFNFARSIVKNDLIDIYKIPAFRSVSKACVNLCQRKGHLITSIDKAPSTQGIYLFATEKDLLYIGMSQNLKARLNSHNQLSRLRCFSDVKVFWWELPECSMKAIEQLETKLIVMTQPPLNTKQTVHTPFSQSHLQLVS